MMIAVSVTSISSATRLSVMSMFGSMPIFRVKPTALRRLYGRAHKQLPQVVNLRSEIDLKSLPVTMRAKVLSMYAKINLNNLFIEDEFHQTQIYSTGIYAAERGSDALHIAGDIASSFRQAKRLSRENVEAKPQRTRPSHAALNGLSRENVEAKPQPITKSSQSSSCLSRENVEAKPQPTRLTTASR